MDSSRFDALTKRIGAGITRRAVLSLVAGPGLGRELLAADGTWAAKSGACQTLCGTCQQCKTGKCRKTNHGRRCKKSTCQPQPDGTPCGIGGVCQDQICVCPDHTEECGGACVNLLTDARHCGACDRPCPNGEGCLHGTCTCDPFANSCPPDETPFEPGGLCHCGAVVGRQFACADGNSACDLDKPCDSNDDCPPRSVCLLGCRDADDPDGPRRCSKPCN